MGMRKKLSLMVIGLSAFLLTPCAASDALPETETELYAAFSEENDAAYEDYAGYQFSGDDPWEGILTITVRSIADGKMDWTFTDVYEGHTLYQVLEDTAIEDGKADFDLQGGDLEDENTSFEYQGSLELKDGKITVTLRSGLVLEDSPYGGSSYHFAEPLADNGSDRIVLERTPDEGLESGSEAEPVYTLENIRDYVVGLDEPVELADGTWKPAINFDNAATTPALQPVLDEVTRELQMYGSIGRGFSQKSNHSTTLYHQTRYKILDFLGADPAKYTCFYVNNTTDGLNKLASALVESKDDVVLATRIEHHANDLPWRERCHVIYAEVDDMGRIRYDEIERLLQENDVKYVTVTAASNVTGYVTDVHRVAKMAHQYGAKIIVDGAQIVAHRQFSMKGETEEEDIDFFVFSAHKMYSPFGGGAVIGLTEVLDQHMPEFYGGGTIKIVGDSWQDYKEAPERYEAGSPNYPGVVGLGKAIEVLQEIGYDRIEEHEKALNRRLIDGLKQYENIVIYGDSENIDDRVGVVTFNVTDINSYILAMKLTDLGGIATRRGAFCANPYVWRLLGVSDDQLKDFEECGDISTPGMIRVSFGIYNTAEEVDAFLEILPEAMKAAEDLRGYGNVNPDY